MRHFEIYHSWIKYATVLGIRIYQEDLTIKSQITNFEQVAHDLRLVQIKGVKGDKYPGFLPYLEADVVRITPDTNLKITFLDATGKPFAPKKTQSKLAQQIPSIPSQPRKVSRTDYPRF